MPGCAGEHRPILLEPQDFWRVRLEEALKFIIGFDHEDRHEIRLVVLLEHVSVRRAVGVRVIEVDERDPGRVIEGAAGRLAVEFDRMDMATVEVSDSLGHRLDHRIFSRIIPIGVVVAAHPDDIAEVLIAIAEVLAVGPALGDAVVHEGRHPATGFNRIEHDVQAVLRREIEYRVHPGEVDFVRRRDVVVRG